MHKTKIITIHQPDFSPHLAFFHRLFLADLLIVLDDVQFLRKGWHNRDKIKTPNGSKWLTVPVQKDKRDQHIMNIKLSDDREKWRKRIFNLLHANYHTAAYFHVIFPHIKKIINKDYVHLVGLNMELIQFFIDFFNVKTKITFSSDYQVGGKRNNKLVNLVTAAKGTHYLTGLGSRSYLDETLFSLNDITVLWQQYAHPVYPQLFNTFMPHLSCIDFAMNCGRDLKEYLYKAGNQL